MAAFARDRGDTAGDGLHRVLGIARQRFCRLAPADQRASDVIGRRGGIKAAVEQRVGNAGLLLHAIGERHIGRGQTADVEDEVRLECEHGFEIGSVAAAGDAAHLRPTTDIRKQELALRAGIGLRPAKQQFGRERIEHDRRRRASGKDPFDVRRRCDRAAGAVSHSHGARRARQQQRGRDPGHNGAAIKPRTEPSAAQ